MPPRATTVLTVVAPSSSSSSRQGRRSASSVGMRFADCCQTTDWGPSMTAAATSSPRLAGRQWRKIASGLRERHQLLGHLDTGASAFARASRSRLLAHRGPHVGVDGVCAGPAAAGSWTTVSSAPDRRGEAYARSRSTRGSGVNSGGHAIVRSRPASAATSSSEWATLSPPSPTKASRRPATVAERLLDRQQVRQRLARMVLVGERVHDRHRRPMCELVDRLLRERADHDRLDVAGERASRVGDRLAASELQLLRSRARSASRRAVRSPPRTTRASVSTASRRCRRSPLREARPRQRSGAAFIDEARSSNSRSSCCVKSATRVKFGETVWARMAPTPPSLSFDVIVGLIVITPSRPSRGGRSSPG